MKKKIWIPLIVVAALMLLAILTIPIETGVLNDGGTRIYTALTYKVIHWHTFIGEGVYDKTDVYFFPYNFKSYVELDHRGDDEEWQALRALENKKIDEEEHTFLAAVTGIREHGVVVQPVEDNLIINSSDEIYIDIEDLEKIDFDLGSAVLITYTGEIMYPAQISERVKSWELSGDFRDMKYTGEWINKANAKKDDDGFFDHLRITKIYSNCFFARPVTAIPIDIKLNGTLSDEWCVGDQITCTYENTYYDQENGRIETDVLTVEASDWQPDPDKCYKPVIYLYPEKETEVSVTLTLDGKLTCTYPAYNDGWKVTALPDGTLIDDKGQTYNYLYWEGETDAGYDLSKGFCVKGEDTASFLEDALERLGLTRREANEFIVYWLPLMEQNLYNIISFQTDIYTNAAQLEIDPAPDTLIRVFMAWKASDQRVELPGQELNAPERTGFTVVEWGGTEIK